MRCPYNDISKYGYSKEDWDKKYPDLKKKIESDSQDERTLLPNGFAIPKEGHWCLYYLGIVKETGLALTYALDCLDEASRSIRSLCPYCNGHEDIEEIISLTEKLRDKIYKLETQGEEDINNQLGSNKPTITVVNTLEDDK